MDVLTKKCSRCNQLKKFYDFYRDNSKKNAISSTCKDCAKEKSREFRLKNPQVSKEYSHQYYLDNTESFKENTKIYQRKKRREDPMFRFKSNLRTRIWKFFNKINKSKRTEELLGCSWQEARNHIESKFKVGMTWENYGEWHVDHIVPLALANSRIEIEHLCRYDNLQPLWAIENLKKSNKYEHS